MTKMIKPGAQSASLSKDTFTTIATASLTATLFFGAGFTHAKPPETPWKEGRILVQPRAGLPGAEFEKILKRFGSKARGRFKGIGVSSVEVPPQMEDKIVKALRKNPHIKFAEKDMLVELSQIVPDDPQFSNAWHLPKIGATTAWQDTLGDGITVAILDSGVDASHPDLQSKMVSGWNSLNQNSTDTNDINGHGTAVAGTVAAATNNGTGISSIAWNAKLMPVRITNNSDGWAYWSDIANGLVWAADNGADVANISYGVSNSSSVSNAAQYMKQKGGLVVAAAGNDGSALGFSDNPHIITVSATTSSDAKASWSSYGNPVDISAPGAGILTTSRGGNYGNWSGTSFASPATAGVVALIMSANSNLTPDEVENILEQSAVDLAGSDWHEYYGNGRVDAAAAVTMALNTTSNPVDEQAPDVTIFSPTSGSTISGLALVEVNATDNMGVTEVALYAGNKFIGSDATSPYQFSLDSTQFADGSLNLKAYAYDAAGNEGLSDNLTVALDNQPDVEDTIAPTVSITNPADGSTVKRTVRINVNAADNVKISSVKLYINGSLKSSISGGSLSYDWNTRKVGSGSNTIEAIAIDSSGNSASQSIQVNVGSSKGVRGKGKNK